MATWAPCRVRGPVGALPLSEPTPKPSGCFPAGLVRGGTSMPGRVPETEHPLCRHSGAKGASPTAATLRGCHSPPPLALPAPALYTHTCPGWPVPPCPVLQQAGSGVQLLFRGVPDAPHHPSASPAPAQHPGRGSPTPAHPPQGGCRGWHSTWVPFPPRQRPCHGHAAHLHQCQLAGCSPPVLPLIPRGCCQVWENLGSPPTPHCLASVQPSMAGPAGCWGRRDGLAMGGTGRREPGWSWGTGTRQGSTDLHAGQCKPAVRRSERNVQ